MGYDAHGPTKQNESQFELIKKNESIHNFFAIFCRQTAHENIKKTN